MNHNKNEHIMAGSIFEWEDGTPVSDEPSSLETTIVLIKELHITYGDVILDHVALACHDFLSAKIREEE